MSWHFSRALVAEYSAATSSAGAPSALSSGSPTPQLYLQHDRMTAFSRLSRSGMTCAPLTDDHSAALLTWYLAASRARTSAPPARARGSTARAPGSGEKWHELSVKYDPRTSSWRTHRCLWEEALQWSSVTLPRWGMTRSGLVFQHPTQERPINATASGLWPTPKANDAEKRGNFDLNNPRNGLPAAAKASIQWPTPTAMMTGDATAVDVFLARQSRLKEKHKGRNGNGCGPDLAMAVKLQMWPTPKASDGKRGHCPSELRRKTPCRPGAVFVWPTPNASDATKWSNQSLADRKKKGQQIRLPTMVSPEGGAGGQLNPNWVEWLMGWPIGWTDLKPLAMDRFREWQQQHSPCSATFEAAA